MIGSVAQFVRDSQAPIKPLRHRPLGQIKARLRRTFKSPENQRVALIDFNTDSLGQQSTFSPADF
jgi:hypothetical protein